MFGKLANEQKTRITDGAGTVMNRDTFSERDGAENGSESRQPFETPKSSNFPNGRTNRTFFFFIIRRVIHYAFRLRNDVIVVGITRP